MPRISLLQFPDMTIQVNSIKETEEEKNEEIDENFSSTLKQVYSQTKKINVTLMSTSESPKFGKCYSSGIPN